MSKLKQILIIPLLPLLIVLFFIGFPLLYGLDFILKKFNIDILHVREKDQNGEIIKEHLSNKYVIMAGSLVLAIIAGYVIYQNAHVTETYAYACNIETNDCYRLRVQMESDEGYRGISKIYFNNGGYISFDDCEVIDEGVESYGCYSSEEEESWSIEIVERARRLK